MSEEFDKLTQQGGINRFGTPDSYFEIDANGNTSYQGEARTTLDLDGLADVEITAPANNDVIQWDSVAGVWKNINDPTLTTAKIGDEAGGNYSEFEADGTLKFNGDAETWVDIDFPLIPRTTGPNIPTYATVQGNLSMPQWAVNDALVCEVQELIHSWREASTVYFHLHLVTSGTNVDARYVRFEVEYTWGNFGATLPANVTLDSLDLLIPANTPARTHIIYSLGNFTPGGGRIGGHVLARLKRIASTGTAPGTNPFIGMMQLHIQQDTTGSREMTSK